MKYLMVAATGHQVSRVYLIPPRPEELIVKLEKGGKVLRGRVVDPEGSPIEGAEILPGLYRSQTDWLPHPLTDEHGEFEIVGYPEDNDQVFPVIRHPRYVTKDSFGQPLTEAVTEVTYELKPGAGIEGYVTNSTGQPLQGIRVMEGTERFASNVQYAETFTDADGHFEMHNLPDGEMRIQAIGDDLAPEMQTVQLSAGKAVRIDFELSKGEDVTGVVTDPKGNPISDVWLVSDTWQGTRTFRRDARTDGEGRFVLKSMPDTPVEVHVIKRDQVSIRDLMVTGGEHHALKMKSVMAHEVHIRLADTKAIPEELEIQEGYLSPGREEIYWQGGRGHLMRNWEPTQGMFLIQIDEPIRGERHYRFRAPGYQWASVQAPDEANEAQTLEVMLKPASVAKGRVIDAESGHPLSGITIALVDQQDQLRLDHYIDFAAAWSNLREITGYSTVSNGEGRFELEGIQSKPDADLLLIKPWGGYIYIPNASSLFEGAEEETIIPYPRSATVEGRVIKAGKPQANVSVHLQWVPPDAGREPWRYPFGFGGRVTTDAEGQFEFRGVGPGCYKICQQRHFDRPGGGGMSFYLQQDDLFIQPGEELMHDIVRPTGFTISGRTIDQGEKSVGSCIVRLNARGDQNYTVDGVRNNPDGTFAIDHVPEGRYELQAEHYSITATATCGLGEQNMIARQKISVSDSVAVDLELKPYSRTRGRPDFGGALAPDFSGNLFESDESFNLEEHLGKVVALEFWATWCTPCMAAMPATKKLYEDLRNQEDAVFVTVSLDQDTESLRKAIEKHTIEFPVIYSGQGWQDPVAKAFGVRGIPSSFVIGRDGRIASGPIHGTQFASEVRKALEQEPSASHSTNRLIAQMTLDGQPGGMPGASLTFTARSGGERILREEIPIVGQAERLR